MVTSTVVRPCTRASTTRRPRRENISTPSAGEEIVYLPLASVTDRVSVPATRTVTPGRGVPPDETTVPETCVWPIAPTLGTSASSKAIPTARRR
jgi:hypothetical protein